MVHGEQNPGPCAPIPLCDVQADVTEIRESRHLF